MDSGTSGLRVWTGPAGLLGETAATHSDPVSHRPLGTRSHYPADGERQRRGILVEKQSSLVLLHLFLAGTVANVRILKHLTRNK